MKNPFTLEIIFSSDPEKQVELVQTINSVLGNSQSYMLDYNLSKFGNRISLTARLENESDLRNASESLEMNLIYGTCRTLGVKLETYVNGVAVNPNDLIEPDNNPI